MNRRRKPARAKANKRERAPAESHADSSAKSPAEESPQETHSNSLPTAQLKWILSLWLVFHLLVLTLSLTASVEPSETQSRILESLQFYVTPPHFSADGLPVYLAWGDTSEQPHRLQTSGVKPSADSELFYAPIDDPRWTTVSPSGPKGMLQNDRYARWLTTAATLAENEQPSLVAELLLSAVATDDSIHAVRIVRLPTEMTTTVDDQRPPPYAASVARRGERVSLVQIGAPRLSTQRRGADDE